VDVIFNISQHAKERQIERGISDAELKSAVVLGQKILGTELKARKGATEVVFKRQGAQKVFIITVITGNYD